MVRNFLRLALQRLGFEVEDANSREEALAVCKAWQERGIDLLIVDHSLPPTNGRALAEDVQTLHPAANVLIIADAPLETVLAQDGMMPRARFLSKPFTIEEAERAVDDAIGAPTRQADPTVLWTYNILVAEDDKTMRYFVTKILVEAGYRVFEARDGAEALDLVRTHKAGIDVLLTNISMPRVSGVRLAEIVRQEKPNVGILYISAESKPEFNLLRRTFSAHDLLREVDRLTLHRDAAGPGVHLPTSNR
jgi:CheY-like chemotaxis protein